VSYHYGYLIESMVSVLLLLTILYCVRLNKQLRLLKADEQSLRATISELITATEIAERAIAGLKATMRDGEQTLDERLQRSEAVSEEIGKQLDAGEQLLARITRITGAAKPAEPAPSAPDAQAVAAAAQAFAERSRARLSGQAGGQAKGRSSGLAA
jgi:chromosome segregation ATPase